MEKASRDNLERPRTSEKEGDGLGIAVRWSEHYSITVLASQCDGIGITMRQSWHHNTMVLILATEWFGLYKDQTILTYINF